MLRHNVVLASRSVGYKGASPSLFPLENKMSHRKLKLEDLAVESFHTTGDARPASGTVMGHAEAPALDTQGTTCQGATCEGNTCGYATCAGPSCAETFCYRTCGATCGVCPTD